MDRKKLSDYTLDSLANMICGNNPPYSCFPYRSSSFLTSFFQDMNLPYCHDGSTRKVWVLDVLKELNKQETNHNSVISRKIIEVIKNLFDIKYFILHFNQCNNTYFDNPEEQTIEHFKNAIIEINKILQHSQYELIYDTKTYKIAFKGLNSVFVSSAIQEDEIKKKIEFVPSVFKIPEKSLQENLVSVMMPFAGFDNVYTAIKKACEAVNFECKRADDIWNNSIFIQDIFDLIYYSKIVIVDFTGKNPNVMYETGIAHTLGKIVIPISQSLEDVPSDLLQHRVLKYLNNSEGVNTLVEELTEKLSSYSPRQIKIQAHQNEDFEILF
jgi:hypothetical protein